MEKTKQKRNPPTRLTEELIQRYAQLLRDGYTLDSAAAHLKMSQGNHSRWYNEARKYENIPEEEWSDKERVRKRIALTIRFKTEAEAALADYFHSLEKIIFAAASREENPVWQAAAWICERRKPEVYGRARREITKNETTGEEGRPSNTSLINLIPVEENKQTA